jgi:hypothetical protein
MDLISFKQNIWKISLIVLGIVAASATAAYARKP